MKATSLNQNKPVVYVVDDDDAVRDSLELFFTIKGLRVVPFSSAKAVLESMESEPNLMILDANMPDVDGFGLLRQLRERGSLVPVILITGLGDLDVRGRAERAGVVGFFDKPVDTPALFNRVSQILFAADSQQH